MDEATKAAATLLQEQITQAAHHTYAPRQGVTFAIYTAIERLPVERCAISFVGNAAGNTASGTLLLYTEHEVARVELTDAPATWGAGGSEWSMRVTLQPRSTIRSVSIAGTYSEPYLGAAGENQLLVLPSSTNVEVLYEGWATPVVLARSSTEDLDAFHKFLLAELRGAS